MPDIELGGIDLNLGVDKREVAEAFSDATTKATKAAGAAAGAARGGATTATAVGAGAAASGTAAASGGIAAAARSHPIVAGVLAALGAVTVGALAVKKAFARLGAEADRLANLNIDLAMAKAIRTVGDIQRGFARAATIGPIMLRIQRQLERLKNLLAPITNFILKQVARVLEATVKGLVVLVESIYQGAINTVQALEFLIIAVANHAVAVVRITKFLLRVFGGLVGLALAGQVTEPGITDFLAQLHKDLEELRRSMEAARDDKDREFNTNLKFIKDAMHLTGRSHFGQIIPGYSGPGMPPLATPP